MKKTPENASRFFPLLLKSTIYEFDASSSQPHQKAAGNACRLLHLSFKGSRLRIQGFCFQPQQETAGNACRLLHLSFKGRRLRIQGFCFQPQQETAGNASGFCSLYSEGSGKRLRIFPLPSEDNRKLPRILFLLLEIFGVKGTFYKKSPCGARGSAPASPQRLLLPPHCSHFVLLTEFSIRFNMESESMVSQSRINFIHQRRTFP